MVNGIEDKINGIELKKEKLTNMGGFIGIDLRANNKFYREYLKPLDFPVKYIDGKMGLMTCTDASLLVPQEQLSEFLRLFKEYAIRNNLSPEVDFKEQNYNPFVRDAKGREEEEQVTFIRIYDRNEC